MRAFIAIELPNELKDKLESFSEGVRVNGLVPVKRDAMHITLQFFADIQENNVEDIKLAMDKTKVGAIDINVNGISYFSPDLLKVIFASINEGGNKLKSLYSELSSNLVSSKIAIKEERSYTPHVTLFRVKRLDSKSSIMSILEKKKELEFGGFTARSIVLKKSVLSSFGPTYTTLHISDI